MKMRLISLLTLGRTLDHAKDRSGAYSLHKVNEFSKLGSARPVASAPPLPVAASPAPAAVVVQPSLFEGDPKPADSAKATETPNGQDPFRGAHAPRVCRSAPSPTVPASPPTSVAPNPKSSPAPAAKKTGSSLWRAPKTIMLAACSFAARPAVRLLTKFRRPAADLRPRAQAELALEKITVQRNDLSEADVMVVPAEKKRPEPPEAKPASAPNPWKGVSARWINRKRPAAGATHDQTAEPRPQPTELSQTPS